MAAGRADIEPQVRSEIGAAVAASKDGAAPTDADFNRTPPDGTLVVRTDEGNEGLYVRVGGEWERVTLDGDT